MLRVYKNSDNKLEIFSAASLIQRFYEGCPLDEIYTKGNRCYEVLLYLLENTQGNHKISEITKLPPEKIKTAAMKIVNLLLFNKENNPFLSLGLSNNATIKEAKKRWKRLLLLYHPDRSANKKSYEEMTKKINQAYRDLDNYREKMFSHEKVIQNNSDSDKVRGKTLTSSSVRINLNKSPYRIYNFKYLKYLPAVILITVVSLAIFTIAIFIMQK